MSVKKKKKKKKTIMGGNDDMCKEHVLFRHVNCLVQAASMSWARLPAGQRAVTELRRGGEQDEGGS